MAVSDNNAPSPWSYIRKLTPLPLRGWVESRWPYLGSLLVLSALLGSLVLVERRNTEPARPVTPTAMEEEQPGGAPDSSRAIGGQEGLGANPDVPVTAPVPLRPVAGRVTKPYGWGASKTFGDYRFHTGVDLAAAIGAEVQAAQAGKVTFAGSNDETGLTVLVLQADGGVALYGNLGSLAVEAGQQVRQGQSLGTVGASDSAESAEPSHLHYEILTASEPTNPGLR